nr:MAG TPA: hypothetical protein [Caudoviricetes sp.]DAK45513.1 MAG TPA: hypothetical protein [Inoviridae sp.]DAR60669.1 MAG TPA: hypothetical protein [Caudoviricetes sp.]
MGFKTCFRRPFLCLSVSQKNIDLILYIVFYWYNMR